MSASGAGCLLAARQSYLCKIGRPQKEAETLTVSSTPTRKQPGVLYSPLADTPGYQSDLSCGSSPYITVASSSISDVSLHRTIRLALTSRKYKHTFTFPHSFTHDPDTLKHTSTFTLEYTFLHAHIQS